MSRRLSKDLNRIVDLFGEDVLLTFAAGDEDGAAAICEEVCDGAEHVKDPVHCEEEADALCWEPPEAEEDENDHEATTWDAGDADGGEERDEGEEELVGNG